MRSTSGRSTVSKVVAIHTVCKQYVRRGLVDCFHRLAERTLQGVDANSLSFSTLPPRVLCENVRVRRRADELEALPAVERAARPEALQCAGRHPGASPERRADARRLRDRTGPDVLLSEPHGEAIEPVALVARVRAREPACVAILARRVVSVFPVRHPDDRRAP